MRRSLQSVQLPYITSGRHIRNEVVAIRGRLNPLPCCLGAIPSLALSSLLPWGSCRLGLLGLGATCLVLKGKIRVEVVHTSGEGVVGAPDEGVRTELMATEGSGEVCSAFLKFAELGSEMDLWDIHDDIKEGDSCAGVLRDLVGEPQIANVLLLSLLVEGRVVFKEEDQPIYRFSADW